MLERIKILPSSLYLFSLGWLGSAISLLGSLLLVSWALAHSRQLLRDLSNCKLCWFCLLAISYLLVHFTMLDTGIELQKAVKQLKGHIILWLFPILGYAIYRSKIPVQWLLLAAAIGLILRILTYTEWTDLPTFIKHRQGFGFAIIGLGLYTGITLLGLLVFFRRFWRLHESGAIWRIIVWWTMFIITGFAWLLTLSRGAWIATFFGLLVVMILWFRFTDVKSTLKQQHWGIWLSAVVLLLFSISVFTNFSDRLFTRSAAYTESFSMDRTKIPYDSVGARVHMTIYGFEKWQEQLWFGWGQGSTRTLLDQDVKLGDWTHFHNSYIQVLAELGVAGFLLYASAFILMLSSLWHSFRRADMPLDMFIFLTAGWSMVLVWSLFDTRMVHVDERFLLLMLSGAGLSYSFRRENPSRGNYN